MQRCSCLFPKKSNGYKPNSSQQKQRRFCLCPENLIRKTRNCCFSCLPVKKSNSLQLQTTPKSTQQKIFHRCFNRISTFIIQTTLNNQRKTLQFQAQIHGHLVCSLNQQILTHKCQHRQIHIFSMPNCSCFLPSQRYPQYKNGCQKENSTQLQTICIFLKTTSQKNTMQRAKKQQKSTKQTPKNCPITQCRCSVIWTCCWVFRDISIKHRRNNFSFLVCNSNHFCNRRYKTTSTIPKQNQKAKKQKKFRHHNNQIQSHKIFLFLKFLLIKKGKLFNTIKKKEIKKEEIFLKPIEV